MPPDDRTASRLRACAAIVEIHGPAYNRLRLAKFLDDLADSYEQPEETTDEH